MSCLPGDHVAQLRRYLPCLPTYLATAKHSTAPAYASARGALGPPRRVSLSCAPRAELAASITYIQLRFTAAFSVAASQPLASAAALFSRIRAFSLFGIDDLVTLRFLQSECFLCFFVLFQPRARKRAFFEKKLRLFYYDD